MQYSLFLSLVVEAVLVVVASDCLFPLLFSSFQLHNSLRVFSFQSVRSRGLVKLDSGSSDFLTNWRTQQHSACENRERNSRRIR